MRYLFFDIEAANSIPDSGKICSFGYVITDEKFNIIEKEDILMNPEGPFQFYKKADEEVPFSLRYSEAVFRKQPSFPNFYERIKELLEYKDQLVIGHSVDNDAHYINDEVMHYNLESINFTFYDTQIMYQEFADTIDQVSLDNVNKLLETNMEQANSHDSLSDALLTMAIAKKMSDKEEKSLSELFTLWPRCKGELNNYVITQNRKIIIKGNEKVKFHNVVRFKENYHCENPKDLLKNKNISLSFYIMNYMSKEAINIVKQIIDLGGNVVKSEYCDIYVQYNKCSDIHEIDKKIPKQCKGKVMNYDDFIKYINLENVDISNISNDLLDIAINGKSHKEITNESYANLFIERKKQKVKEKEEESLGNRFKDFFDAFSK